MDLVVTGYQTVVDMLEEEVLQFGYLVDHTVVEQSLEEEEVPLFEL
jgi:hypothetical protein